MHLGVEELVLRRQAAVTVHALDIERLVDRYITVIDLKIIFRFKRFHAVQALAVNQISDHGSWRVHRTVEVEVVAEAFDAILEGVVKLADELLLVTERHLRPLTHLTVSLRAIDHLN